MPNHRARRLLGAATLALVAILPASAAGAATGSDALTATAANIITWDSNTGLPITNAIVKATSQFNKGDVPQSCVTFANEGRKGLAAPYPPNSQLAFHWGAAMAFYQVGGEECSAAFTTLGPAGKALLNKSITYSTDGLAQLKLFSAEFQTLTGV